MSRTRKQLRQHIDGSDNFMGGFQIGKAKTCKRQTPSWVNNNAKVAAILLSAFSKLKNIQTQRARAARWANVIHYYFRLHYTETQVSEELELSLQTVHSLIRNIKRVASGYRANGSGLKGGKRGRPKNSALN